MKMKKRLLATFLIICLCLATSVQSFAYTSTSYFSSSYGNFSTNYYYFPYETSYAIDDSIAPEEDTLPEPAPVVTPAPAPVPAPVVTPAPAPVPATTVQPALKMTVVKIGKDTDYETPMYVFDSGVPGKTVWINGGTHGNETSGYQAALKFLDQVKNGTITIKTGKLIILPEANKRAIDAHRRFSPDGVNLNLAFPKTATSPAPTYPLAKAIWTQLLKYKPDYFMDLHESVYYHNLNSDNTGQTIIYMPMEDGKTVATNIINELNKKITDPVAKYALLRYPVSGSIARATSECLGTVSFIPEACDNEPLATRINNHVNTCKYLLKFVGMN